MRLLALTALLLAGPTWAADMSPPPQVSAAAADPLAAPRQLIAARDWAGALATLRAQPQAASADWHNLVGYSLRKQAAPDLARAESHYLEALRIDPGHRGASEYLGELYLMKGDLTGAEKRLAVLAQLCPGGCEEREDLARAVTAFKAKKP
ncbi:MULTISPECIES: lipopolysaccharide assembly protein LapB [unclassified Roseateles]|uniref:tetratricopeptide repeat protein n=1 Tax=unclassified Roseateles TaxID=2626991 RepID=UPI0006F24D7C|nr:MULTISPECIES: hypothetical protein [unclassified Roseateles]KQW51637.1 hypothetical protein ASC81_03140 [Pelomonas sp. Root405]KRA77870.1 hypothetical protein ASD88_03140 [Pelomonas sp. Root662]